MKRWKQFYPLLRCPGCRRWLRIVSRGEYKLSLATKDEVKAIGKGDEDV